MNDLGVQSIYLFYGAVMLETGTHSVRIADYVVVSTDNIRETNRLAEEAEADGGELLIAGPKTFL